MGRTEQTPAIRTIAAIMDLLDARYAKTDSERARAWLTSFTEFKRETGENYKDFWARFTRFVAKLEALGMPMGDKVVSKRVIRALRLPDGQLPIVLSSLETRPDRFSAKALQEITIRMYETHKSGGDSSDVYNATTPANTESQEVYRAGDNDWFADDWYDDHVDWENEQDDEVTEVTLEDGSIMLMKPKKPTKPRDAPGIREASRMGAVKTFSHIPNRKGKGGRKSVCLRCGDPSHHRTQRTHPFRETLCPRFSHKRKRGREDLQIRGCNTRIAHDSCCSNGSRESGKHPHPCGRRNKCKPAVHASINQ